MKKIKLNTYLQVKQRSIVLVKLTSIFNKYFIAIMIMKTI